MAFTRIDNDQLKDLTITNDKISTTAGIEQSKVQNLVSDLSDRVLKSGDTMTGSLFLNADPVGGLEAATKQYVDSNFVTKAGDTLTGFLTLNADPINALQAATKQYVDGQTSNKLPLAGGTLSGPLILSADPATDLEAATKQYVDNLINSTVINSLSGVLSGGVCSTDVIPSTTVNVFPGIGTSSVNNIFVAFPSGSVDLLNSGADGLESSSTLAANTVYYLYVIFPNDLSSFATLASVDPLNPDLPLGFDDYINLNTAIVTYLDTPDIYIIPFEIGSQGTRKTINYTNSTNFADTSLTPSNVGLTCISTPTGTGSFELIDVSTLVSTNATAALISISCAISDPSDTISIRPTGVLDNGTIVNTNGTLGFPTVNKTLVKLDTNKTFELKLPLTTSANVVVEGYLI